MTIKMVVEREPRFKRLIHLLRLVRCTTPVSLVGLRDDEVVFRRFKVIMEGVQGSTKFCSMDFSCDKCVTWSRNGRP